METYIGVCYSNNKEVLAFHGLMSQYISFSYTLESHYVT